MSGLTDRNNYICAIVGAAVAYGPSVQRILINVMHLVACVVCGVYNIMICVRVRSSLGTLCRDPIKIHETPPIRPIRLASVGESKKNKIKTNRINYYTVVYDDIHVTCKAYLGGLNAMVVGLRVCGGCGGKMERCKPRRAKLGVHLENIFNSVQNLVVRQNHQYI